MELDPKNTETLINRGQFFITFGKFDKALDDFSKAIQIDPNNGKAYSRRAVAYYYLKEYKKSWSDVNKAQELDIVLNSKFLTELNKHK